MGLLPHTCLLSAIVLTPFLRVGDASNTARVLPYFVSPTFSSHLQRRRICSSQFRKGREKVGSNGAARITSYKGGSSLGTRDGCTRSRRVNLQLGEAAHEVRVSHSRSGKHMRRNALKRG